MNKYEQYQTSKPPTGIRLRVGVRIRIQGIKIDFHIRTQDPRSGCFQTSPECLHGWTIDGKFRADIMDPNSLAPCNNVEYVYE